MKIVLPDYEILTPINRDKLIEIYKLIELSGRTCYKSEDKITVNSAKKFVKMIINRGHESVLEHFNISVRFICNRGFTHELVRHRLASFSQESTRYVRYANKLELKEIDDDSIIDLYNQGLSMRKISELSKGKITEWGVYKTLDRNDIKRRNRGNTGIIEDSFFANIDKPLKAYLLGFIQADGSISTEKNSLTITQKNGFFIEEILKNIKLNLSGSTDRNCKQYQICNSKIINDLVNKGIVPNKTYSMTQQNALDLWSSIPVNLKHDFIRGLIDGDGNLRFFKQSNPNQTDSCNIGITGNKFLLQIIGDFISNTYGYNINIKHFDNYSRMAITNPQIGRKFCDNLYKNFKFPYGHPIKTSRGFEAIDKVLTLKDIDKNYLIDGTFQVIAPATIFDVLSPKAWVWMESMINAEKSYTDLINMGCSPQEARGVLPIDVKTEIVVTANLREWRHIFKLRCGDAAHPSMRELMIPLQYELGTDLPEIFDYTTAGKAVHNKLKYHNDKDYWHKKESEDEVNINSNDNND